MVNRVAHGRTLDHYGQWAKVKIEDMQDDGAFRTLGEVVAQVARFEKKPTTI